MLSRGLMRALSSVTPGGTLSTFIFHRVLPEPDPLLPWEPDAEQFDWMLRFIAGTFEVVHLAEGVERLRENRLHGATAAITFDDGYADNLSVALPLLRRHRLPATCFVATAYLDGGRMWNDDVIEAVRKAPAGRFDLSDFDVGVHDLSDATSRVRSYGAILSRMKYLPYPKRLAVAREISQRAGVADHSTLMMTGRQLCELHAAGVAIGGHTHSHPILESLSDQDAERDLVEGRRRLMELLDAPVSLFAYPNGIPGKDFSGRHAEMAKRAGFVAAVSTSAGAARPGADLYQLPRFTPWDRTPARFALRSARNIFRQGQIAPVAP